MMLYLHIPFCKHKCKYCAFYSGVFADPSIYISKLLSFIEYYCKGRSFQTVYIGGGTPSALPLDLWERLLQRLRNTAELDNLIEFTVELNPESTSEALLYLLKRYGVNRLSFGIQSLSDKELKEVGRIHTATMALDAVYLAQSCGFENISCDLIYGLPGQTAESFQNSLHTLLALGIPHLSCYNLQVEEGTPLFEEQDRLSFPMEEEQMAMHDILLAETKAFGLHRYEISNFAIPGKEAVHNSGYWTHQPYIGLGPSAHSFFGNCRYSFAEDINTFINKKDFSFDETLRLTSEDIHEEQIMLGLRTRHGAPLSSLDRATVQKYVSAGFGNIVENRFVLNDRGLMISNTIISDFI